MSGIVCIMQSNYIPWKGYFDLVRHADHFIFLDDVQYSKGWRNRNKIKTKDGLRWLSVPVSFSFSDRQNVEDVEIVAPDWSKTHLTTIQQCYGAAPHFDDTMAWFQPLMEEAEKHTKISDINQLMTKRIAKQLGSKAKFARSTDVLDRDALAGFEHNADRIVQLTKALGGDACLNGPTAKAFTDTEYCRLQGVRSLWANYADYPEYPQLHGAFTHAVSIVDMFMMLGTGTVDLMKTDGFAEAHE